MLLADPIDVPPELVEDVAEQSGIDDPSVLPEYLERRKTWSSIGPRSSRPTACGRSLGSNRSWSRGSRTRRE